MGGKRNLYADLELCEQATPGRWYTDWYIDDWGNKKNVVKADDGRTYIGEFFQTNDETFIAEAREGWPYAIKRAIEAEKQVEELKLVLSAILRKAEWAEKHKHALVWIGVLQDIISITKQALEGKTDA